MNVGVGTLKQLKFSSFFFFSVAKCIEYKISHLSVQFSGMKCIYTAVQTSPLSIPRTFHLPKLNLCTHEMRTPMSGLENKTQVVHSGSLRGRIHFFLDSFLEYIFSLNE